MLKRKIESVKNTLSRLPSYLFTIVTAMLIMWLTLVPDPLGDDAPSLFPGADKIVHAIMFGWLTCMLLLDYQRKHSWDSISWRRYAGAVVISAVSGVAIEFAQREMSLGRGFEYADMVADGVGAIIAAPIYFRVSEYYLRKKQ